MSGPVDIEYGPDAWHTPTQPEAYADLEQQADAMREALRRLGDLADAADRKQTEADNADTDQWSLSHIRLMQREASQAKSEAVAAVRAARDLYAPKESGQ